MKIERVFKTNYDLWTRESIETAQHLSAQHGVELVGLFNRDTGYATVDGQKLIPRSLSLGGIEEKNATYTTAEDPNKAWRLFDFQLKEYLAEKTKVIWKATPALYSMEDGSWTVLAELVAWTPVPEQGE